MVNKQLKTDAENWEKVAPKYIEFIKERGKHFSHLLYGPLLANLLELTGNIYNKKVLDAGCGEGHLSRLFAKKGANVYGCDASKTMIHEAIQMDDSCQYKPKYFLHDLTMSFGLKYKNLFDIVVCNLVLFDIRDLDKVVKNISTTLKPGGRFIFSILHPCFNLTKENRYNLRNIGYNGGTVTFKIKKSYKSHTVYARDSISDFSIHGTINHYHRPIESYVESLARNSFVILNIKEPVLELDQIYENGPYHRHYFPKFLLFNSKKLR